MKKKWLKVKMDQLKEIVSKKEDWLDLSGGPLDRDKVQVVKLKPLDREIYNKAWQDYLKTL